MGDLDVVEEDHVFQFHRVAYHAVFSYQGRTPDESAVADFRVGTDDAGGTKECGRSHGGSLMYPDGGGNFGVFFAQGRPQGQD